MPSSVLAPRSRLSRLRRWSIAGAAAAALGGGVFAVAPVGPAGASDSGRYRQTNLVSDIPGVARITDPNLVNPWGMSEFPGGPLWVSDNGADVSTLYTGAQHGAPLAAVPLVVRIPGGAPTGQVHNPSSGFVVHAGGAHAAAVFLFASETGRITGWAPSVPTPPPGSVSDRAETGATIPNAVYKGLAIDTSGASPRLFATNFHSGAIDVFGPDFKLIAHPGRFVDPHLPRGYAPFGIADLDGRLFVSYAVQDAQKHDDVAGHGHGIVDVYSLQGVLLHRLITHDALNSPWGMVRATGHFGQFSGALLVGNFGNGIIHAYDPNTGRLEGTLTNPDGNPIQINGLWGLIFGDQAVGTADTLIFSAGIADEAHGLLGTLEAGGTAGT